MIHCSLLLVAKGSPLGAMVEENDTLITTPQTCLEKNCDS
jgi:hypothetical protein